MASSPRVSRYSKSLNNATVKLAEQGRVYGQGFAEIAKGSGHQECAGYSRKWRSDRMMPHPLDMASAYTVIANKGGAAWNPSCFRSVRDRQRRRG